MVSNNNFYNELQKIIDNENILIHEPMSKHTSFKIGGAADYLLLPKNKTELSESIKLCKKYGIQYFIIGNGSNLLISDEGIRGVVIKTSNFYNTCKVSGEIIKCDAGILLSKVANVALENSLSGLEFASGIPGTLGGAILMNAGAYGGEMKDIVYETEYLDNEGVIKTVKKEDHQFGYRSSIFQRNNWTVISSKLNLLKAEKTVIKEKMIDLNRRRKEKQPLDVPSAGSVFRRPEGYYAGKLIEDCGLRGYKVGGAQVSEKHCGFIVNNGDATSQEVLKLIDIIRQKVLQEYKVELKTEIKYIGDRSAG